MSSIGLKAGASTGGPARAPQVRLAGPHAAAALAAVAALALLIQGLWLPVDADVSWLITVSERMLGGDRLYRDIFELNPPASVWLYLPLVWLAQAIGARPEGVVVAAFLGTGALSALATLRLAARLDQPPPALPAAIALGCVTLVLPMALFAQREHVALLLALPALATLARVAEGQPPSRRVLIAGGIAAGLVIVIKPYFLLVMAAPALWAAYRRRSLVPLLPALAAGAVVVATYGAAVFAFATEYFAWLPVITHTYGPMHDSWWKVFAGPVIYPAICLGLVILARPRRIPPLAVSFALGAAGFVVAAIAQLKNYPNHVFPALALALLAALVVVARSTIARRRRIAVFCGLIAVALVEMHHWAIRPAPAVAAAILRVAPPAPRIIALSPDLVTGHPVTRNVGGTWVGSRAGLFTAAGARFVNFRDPIARAAYREDIASFARDVERGAPDVVLVDGSSKKWLMREPQVAATMRGFAPVAIVGETELWVRRR